MKIINDINELVKLESKSYIERSVFENYIFDFSYGGIIYSFWRNLNAGTVIFKNCIFKNEVNISIFNCNSNINIENCVFNDKLLIKTDNYSKDIVFTNCTIKNGLEIKGDNKYKVNSIYFKDLVCAKGILINDLHLKENLFIHNKLDGTIRTYDIVLKNLSGNSFSFSGVDFQTCSFSDIKFNAIELIDIYCKKPFNIDNSSSRKLKILFDSKYSKIGDVAIELNGCTFGLISIDELCYNTKIKINNTSFCELNFIDLSKQ